MPFETYENRSNPHVTIHVEGCTQLRKRGGEHQHSQGAYHSHATYQAAAAYAESTGLPLVRCSFCTPQSHG